MFQRIEVRNFQSLHAEGDGWFRLDMAPFTCLVGLNGSGKSTILQFFDFLRYLALGQFTQFFKAREWEPGELKFTAWKALGKSIPRHNIDFYVTMDLDGEEVAWEAAFNPYLRRCTAETFCVGEVEALRVKDGRYRLGDRHAGRDIEFDYEGSILASLKDPLLPEPLRQLKQSLQDIRTLELLAPNLLRRRARGKPEDIGRGGESISAFLHELDVATKESINDVLREMFPQYSSFATISPPPGWKILRIAENYRNQRIAFDARHASDGLLRLLGVVAATRFEHSLFLFEEIENGVNPEVIEHLVELLVECPSQVLATTHNPLILNYLDDDIAKQSVQFVYKTASGMTRAVPFFSLPEVAEKLEGLGPGEVYLDTNLEELAAKLAQNAGEPAE